MNQDPNNPTMPNSAAPEMPAAPDFSNPAAAAAPNLEAMPAAPDMSAAPEAPAAEATPAMPEAPTIDPSLLQQAIADVPEEAGAADVQTAVPLDNLGAASTEAPAETSPFTTAAPAADFSANPEAPAATPEAAPTDPTAVASEAPKSTPSVAFNDPAQQPDAKPHQVKLPKIDLKKINPVVLIVAGSAIIILALIFIIAFAV